MFNIMNPKYFISLKQPDFQLTTGSLKLNVCTKTHTECRSSIHYASVDTFKAKTV